MQPSPLASYNRLWSVLKPVAKLHLHLRSWRGREDKSRLSERYGKSETPRPKGPLFWLHAVSVGESVAALTLAASLREICPDLNILITTNTITAAERIAAQNDPFLYHAYQPLDHPQWVAAFLRHWHPDYAVMLESDFWPNLISCTAAQNIPLCFASSQLSDKAFQAWQRRPELARAIFTAARDIFSVDSQQAKKFSQLAGSGPNKPRIHIGGSLKLNPASLKIDNTLVDMVEKAANNRPVVVAASTHKGEETLIAEASRKVQENGLPHFLIMAPRHPERGSEIAASLNGAGQRSKDIPPQPADDIYICDSLGEMGSLYTAAELIILGGTFADLGGHNQLEIALFETPVLAGASRFKNTQAFEQLTHAGLIEQADDAATLASALTTKLSALREGRALISDKDRKQIAAIAAEACSRATNTAKYVLDTLSENTSSNT